ncbi:RNA 2'-phosphotransferase [Agromyces sp. NPDC058110]|uniref:RNA 2'-phosphotransferase n=1 Tax=Agromyces sp. NPDC058110 TaxID=3346345 RepID=UPI0036D900F7
MTVLVSLDASPFQVAAAVRDVVDRQGLPLLAYLVAEAILNTRSASVAGYLRSSGTSLKRVLSQLADRLGEAFLDAAFSVTWQRPAVFARLLTAARAYLEWTRQEQILEGSEPRRGTQTRLGIAAVLATRFGPISEHELRGARQMLLDSHVQGAEKGLEYYVEASIWLYDLFDDPSAIQEAAQQLNTSPGSDAAESIMAAHLWLRLSGIASRPHGVEGFIARGREVTARWHGWVTNRYEDAALVLLQAAFDQLEEDLHEGNADLSTRGLLFPFGHRRPDTPTAPLFQRCLPRFTEVLKNSDKCGDFVFRDLIATFLSMLARGPAIEAPDAIRALEDAIATREGSGKERGRPIRRVGIEVEQAGDRFLLAHLTSNAETRRLGFIELAKAAGPDDLRPRLLTMIAKEVEEHGALAGGFVPGPEDVTLAIRRGDATAIFEAAARAAYSSADLTQVPLGGRGDVVTLRDSDGIAGQTFVYKRTRPEAKARDETYSRAVAEELDIRDLQHRFGLIEHLTSIPDVKRATGDPELIVSVRRFTDGVPLLDHLRVQEPGGATATLVDVAEFLAHIHFAGLGMHDVSGTRVSLKEAELGRWLRALQLSDDERASFFGRWWTVVETAPLVPRRDAHPLNWLISSDDKIRAVDLESRGSRPFGYELAQLVEDGQVLPPTYYEGRQPILDAYAHSWARLTGEPVDSGKLREWYDAGALARAVRAISQPNASSEHRAYGGELLAVLAEQAAGEPVQKLAAELAKRWNRMTGRVGQEESRRLSEADRRRISRAMSHHLRHDREALATKSGWVHVDELAQLLRASGHKVSSDQLLLIAGALGEPRFELDGHDVRAAYGHSIPTQIAYEVRRAPQVLFHATPTRNLASVFEARAGLRPSGRNWVHLTESCQVAVDAARRQRSAVSVLEVDAHTVAGLVHAAGATWLAPTVPVGSIRIMPVRRVRESTLDYTVGIHGAAPSTVSS